MRRSKISNQSQISNQSSKIKSGDLYKEVFNTKSKARRRKQRSTVQKSTRIKRNTHERKGSPFAGRNQKTLSIASEIAIPRANDII